METPAEKLLKSLKSTAGANFIAAKRLENHDRRLTRLTAFASSYVIILTALPYFFKLPSTTATTYDLVTLVFAVVILISSLLQYSNNNIARAEQHHRSGLEVNELHRLLLVEGENPSKETLVDFTKRYSSILQKYSINHDELDYSKYQVDRPEEHTWMKWPRKCQIHFQLAVEKYTPDAFLIFITCVFFVLVYHGATIAAIN